VGHVLDAHTADKDRRPSVCLSVLQFMGALPVSVGGLSGTPVLAGRRVVGQLFRVLGAEDGWQLPHLGLCFATPAWAVAGLFAARGTGEVSAEVQAPAAANAAPQPLERELIDRPLRYAAHAEALASIQVAGDLQALRQALARYEAAAFPRKQGRLLAGEVLVGMAAAEDALDVLEPVADTDRGRQLRALAVSLRGDPGSARALLSTLPATEERAGIDGGILKRRWLREGGRGWLLAAHGAYRKQNAAQPTPYLAVNVAALALQLGDEAECRREADRARTLVLDQPEGARDYWAWASLAEAELLLGDLESAREHFQHAAADASAGGLSRDVAVMRRQARLDLEKLGRPRGALDDVLPVGRVACAIGALLDDADWDDARVTRLRDQIAAFIRDRQVQFGFGSAAGGADLLFAGALIDRNATPTIFLPAQREAFEAKWVRPRWRGPFRRIPTARMQVVEPLPGDSPFSGTDAKSLGAAVEMGSRLDELPLLIAVLPPPGVDDVRGVEAAVARWNEGTYEKATVLTIS
jgi:tetratricopeptide (TPR) repeat protein